MSKLILNSIRNFVFISGAIVIIGYSFIKIKQEKINSQDLITNKTIVTKNEIKSPPIKNEKYATEFLSEQFIASNESTKKLVSEIKLNSAQAIAYKKVDPKKEKLLKSILSNDNQRKKFEYVMKKAEELKLPSELALIPVIESEYSTKAVSRKGAGGLWQLMPGTAKIFGLSKKKRFDMAASTKAALLHLKDLYTEFGNWELAIAAYNAGDGKVTKALKRNTKAKTVQDLKLPRETRNYVLAFFQLHRAFKSYSLT